MSTSKPPRPWTLWDPLSGTAPPAARALVEVTRDLFDDPAKEQLFPHSGGGCGASYIWDRRAVYLTPTRHPARMRALLRTWGGYAPEGQDLPSTEYRDFAENHIPALIVERASDTWGWTDLLLTPAACRAVIVTPREKFDITPMLQMWHRPDWVIVRGPSGPEAWPMFPTWVYGVRDACKAARVPFTFCGWGDFVPETDAPIQISGFSKRRRAWLDEGAPDPRPVAQGEEGRWWTEKLIQEWGSLRESGAYFKETTPFSEEVAVYRVGTERAGKLLEGVAFDERPACVR